MLIVIMRLLWWSKRNSCPPFYPAHPCTRVLLFWLISKFYHFKFEDISIGIFLCSYLNTCIPLEKYISRWYYSTALLQKLFKCAYAHKHASRLRSGPSDLDSRHVFLRKIEFILNEISVLMWKIIKPIPHDKVWLLSLRDSKFIFMFSSLSKTTCVYLSNFVNGKTKPPRWHDFIG